MYETNAVISEITEEKEPFSFVFNLELANQQTLYK